MIGLDTVADDLLDLRVKLLGHLFGVRLVFTKTTKRRGECIKPEEAFVSKTPKQLEGAEVDLVALPYLPLNSCRTLGGIGTRDQ